MERLFGKLGFSFFIVFLLAVNVNAGGAIAGKVSILKGQVFIKRGSAKIPVKKDDTILESDIIESEAGTARITMIDSNLVDVYPRSRVEIAKYVYKPNQDQKEVELKVDFGKIKSTVNQKYDGAKNKFQVKTPSAVAGVRGTVFTTEYDAVRKISKVVTIEGLVAVTKMIDRERQSPPVFVRPDQVVKVDVEQSKAEQPRDLKADERESAQKQDKDLGYQYDPKKEQVPDQGSQPPAAGEIKGTVAQPSSGDKTVTTGSGSPDRPALGGGVISDRGSDRKERREDSGSIKETNAREPVKEIAVKEVKDVKEVKEIAVKEVKEIREPVKEISIVEPVKEIKEQVREQIKEIREPVKNEPKETKEQAREQIKEIKTNLRERLKEAREEKREQQQEAKAKREQQSQQEQERRQKEAEQEQVKKQKQLEDEQAKKQKQLEDEQAKKQKQLEEEQAKKQKQLEDEQARKQKQIEDEQLKKQIQLEEAQKKAEAARLAAELAKRAETVIAPIKPPSTDSGTIPNLLTPRK